MIFFMKSKLQLDYSNALYLLALSYIKGIGSISAQKILNQFDSPERVFTATKHELLTIPDIGNYIVSQLQKEKKQALQLAEKELNFALKENLHITSYQDSNYPTLLKKCPDAPLILFSKGNLLIAEHQKLISIVGTRNCTAYGKQFIQELISDLKEYQPIIISGLALGCDAQAHQEALNYGLPTWGVLAHGLNQLYPPQHQKLAMQMMENGGVLTEFSSFHKPIRENFLKRNRIIAGLSPITIIVESAKKGGAITTAKVAFDYNRDVFALPGNIQNRYSEGCHELIKNNVASLITSANDIITLLQWENKHSAQKSIQKSLFIHLEETEQRIYDYLIQHNTSTIDQLSLALHIPTPRLSVELLNMELKGAIQALSGNKYTVC